MVGLCRHFSVGWRFRGMLVWFVDGFVGLQNLLYMVTRSRNMGEMDNLVYVCVCNEFMRIE